jgi:hypothetical protein
LRCGREDSNLQGVRGGLASVGGTWREVAWLQRLRHSERMIKRTVSGRLAHVRATPRRPEEGFRRIAWPLSALAELLSRRRSCERIAEALVRWSREA